MSQLLKMKKILIPFVFLLLAFTSFAQTDLSGAYGYSLKPEGNPPETEKNRGPEGKLVLVKMDGNQYRFWLDVTTGWPNYHVGETDGTITFVNDTASFDNTHEDEQHPCILKFKITGKTIAISSPNSSHCEFGAGVNADGNYTWLAAQPLLNNEWLQKEYGQSAIVTIRTGKAEVFRDENCKVSFSPKRYFNKGEKFPAIARTANSIYTEHITASGQLLYGWITVSSIEIAGSN